MANGQAQNRQVRVGGGSSRGARNISLLADDRREFHCLNRDAAAFDRERQDVAGLIMGVERQRNSI